MSVGAEVLSQLQQEGRTVSELWERVRSARANTPSISPLTFDWFVLSLAFLYAISVLEFIDGVVSVKGRR